MCVVVFPIVVVAVVAGGGGWGVSTAFWVFILALPVKSEEQVIIPFLSIIVCLSGRWLVLRSCPSHSSYVSVRGRSECGHELCDVKNTGEIVRFPPDNRNLSNYRIVSYLCVL